MLSTLKREFTPARVLYRQFLFRIVELESLSSKADVTKLLGQFASILVMFSLIEALLGFSFTDVGMTPVTRRAATWSIEHQLLSLTLLIVGLFSILSWEALLPDQRDVFVLGPLPVKPLTLCLAKVTASASAVGLSALALNCASGLIWPAVLAQSGFTSVLRSYVAYWLTLLFAALFLFSAALVLQSAAALLLSRSAFLRLSPVLQVIMFTVVLASFFFEPAGFTPERVAIKSGMAHVSWFPPYCFTAVFFQLQGDLPIAVTQVAVHGWILLAATVLGAVLCCAALYTRLLRRIAATPDIVRARSGLRRSPSVDYSFDNTLLVFIGRAFSRSRQQRLILAFYMGVGSAMLLAVLGMATAKTDTLVGSPPRISLQFLVSTIVAMTVVVVGIRAGFAFPISLRANWVFRLHQIQLASAYLRATRRALIVLTVVPVCFVSAICGLIFEPASAALEHIALLGLYGYLLAGICLYRNLKLPYTCSYLPGTAQLPYLFWGNVILFIPMTDAWVRAEQRILYSVPAFSVLFLLLTLIVGLLEWRSRAMSLKAELRFEEIPDDVVVGLGLSGS